MYTTTKTVKDNYYGTEKTVTVLKPLPIIMTVLMAILIFMSFGIVTEGKRGVRTQFGKAIGTVDQGIYFKLPIIQSVKKIDVRTQVVKYEIADALTSASKDLQDVKVSAVVTYHVDPTKVIDLYRQYQNVANHDDRIVRPNIRDSVKAITSAYTAEELVTKRAEYSDKVRALLNERLSGSFAIVEQSNITNLEFSPSFTQAIENKVTAVQNAEAQKNKLEQVKYEAQQKIETAKAEAEAIRIQASAINSQGGADFVNLKAVEKWNGILPTQMIPNASVPFINLN